MFDWLVWEMSRHPHRMTFGHIKLHLPISLPLCKPINVFLEGLSVRRRLAPMNLIRKCHLKFVNAMLSQECYLDWKFCL